MVFCFGPWPRSAVVLVVFAWDDTQIWLGDLHFVFPLVAGFCVCFAVATVVFELYGCGLVKLVQRFADLIRLSCFKDRASELYLSIGRTPKKKRRDVALEVNAASWNASSECGVRGECGVRMLRAPCKRPLITG